MEALKEAIVNETPDLDIMRHILLEKPYYIGSIIDQGFTGTPLHLAGKADTAFCRKVIALLNFF